MKKVLITGARGFVGRNLTAELKKCPDKYELMLADIDTPQDTLFDYLKSCDFVVHLAGINRPNDESEFTTGNANFTIFVLEKLVEFNNVVPVAITSSIQSELDNAYGKSKAAAESAVLSYGKDNDISVFVWKLPNVFGKWCRPNYNSAIATFCYNITHDLPVEVNAPERVMTLIYIDDLLRLLRGAIDGVVGAMPNGYCNCPVMYSCTLQYIPDKLMEFKKCRENLIMPTLKYGLDKALYSTFLSYYDENNFSYKLKVNEDERGLFAEAFKTDGFGQWSISTTAPGITRGNHWHHTKVEKFVVVSGEALIRFRRVDDDKITEYRIDAKRPTVVDIPVGYTHSITNSSETEKLVTIIWANELFDNENSDTFHLEV